MNYRDNRQQLPCLAFALLLGLSATVFAQSSQQKPPSQNQPRINVAITADKSSMQEEGPPLTTFEEEMRAKRAIKLAEKEHEENLGRAKEISQLSKELQEEAKRNPASLNREALKRIDRIEKLAKKIRGEAGGEDGEISIPDRPNNLPNTVVKIADVAESLAKNVQNTPRQVVSASVIDSANVLLELIKIARTLAR